MSLLWPSATRCASRRFAPELHNGCGYFRLQIETSARQVSLSRSRRGGDRGANRVRRRFIGAADRTKGKPVPRTKHESGARNARARAQEIDLLYFCTGIRARARAAAPSPIPQRTDDKFAKSRIRLACYYQRPWYLRIGIMTREDYTGCSEE